MLRKEFKDNFKAFLIWTIILIIMLMSVYLIYPFMMTDETIASIDEMMKIFPPEMLKAFNMDITSISTAYGWLKTEGFMYILLGSGIYSSILGCNIVLKEEAEKTIEYLGVLPVKRSKIMTNKIIVALTYIVGMIVALGLFNFIALLISGDFNKLQFLLLSISPLFLSLPLFALGLLISTLRHKTKKTIGISLAIVFVGYLLTTLSELSSKVEFLKYLSIYTLADTRNIVTNIAINPVCVIVSIGLTILFTSLSYLRYQKKELI